MASLCRRHFLIVKSIQQHLCKRTFLLSARFLQAVETPHENVETDLPTPPFVPQQKLPLMTSRKLAFTTAYSTPKQAWLESLEQVEDEKLGIVDLHPEIFGCFPRLDLLWWNMYWQKMYNHVNYDKTKTRAEMRGGGRKPWPQKGLGKARHGSIRSPLWKSGAVSHGPRGPKSYFFMLQTSVRLRGLTTALSVKLAQDNLHIVENLNVPSDEPEYIQDLVESRSWGLSVLFVDEQDVVPRNFAVALDQIAPYNCMPVYGLNVHSMLKHETLVMTLAALERLEERLLFHMHNKQHHDIRFSRLSTKV